MARITFMGLALLLVAASCPAGVGEFGIYSDATGYNCHLFDNGGGAIVTVYVVHHFYFGDQATTSRFGIELSGGITWSFLSFQSAYGSSPATLGDISLNYGSCIGTATNIASVQWMSTVAAPGCSTLLLKPAVGTPTIIATDCAFNEQAPGFVNFMVVNANGACDCFDAIQPTTWGSVKSLYR